MQRLQDEQFGDDLAIDIRAIERTVSMYNFGRPAMAALSRRKWVHASQDKLAVEGAR